MNNQARGFWGIADQSLQWIGRGIAWLLLRRRSTTDEGPLDAAIGGALVCAAFGGIFGFVLSDHSRNITAIDGTILGSMLGMCIGILFGLFVETIHTAINDLLRSLNSK
jgi:hypothetical protein